MLNTTLATSRFNRDFLRQLANIVLAAAQIVVTLIGYAVGSNAKFSTSTTTTPQVVPADYAFSIWSLIYLGALVYAIYQALPRHKEDELLRRTGFFTASAYLATTVWLIAAQLDSLWLPALCLFWMLGSLLGAFIQFLQYTRPFSRQERSLVVLPTSIYLGWATVACIANMATALQAAGFHNVLLSNQSWAIVMLIVGGAIAAFVTRVSRGNVAYALTIVWALIGVVVANIVRTPSLPVAVTAGIIAALVVVVLFLTRSGLTHILGREG